MTTALTVPAEIKKHSNLHIKKNLRLFGSKAHKVIRYILESIHKYHKREQTFFESYATIADVVGCSERTVERAVDQARNLGIFATKRRQEWTGKYKTVDGKKVKQMKDKTNRIWLLPYKELQLEEVVELPVIEVEEQKKEETLVVEEKPKTEPTPVTKGIFDNFKSWLFADDVKQKTQVQQQPKKSVRSEIVPNWVDKYANGEDYAPSPSVEIDPERRERIEALKQKFAKKYN